MSLLDVADGLASTYSGGMVRRLELAQALVNRPSLLILDEPTVGLDPIARDGVWAQVRRMQEEFGMTVLLTTHYMEEADALCDRVALMHHGRLQRCRLTGRAEEDRRPGRDSRGCVPALCGNGFRRRRIADRIQGSALEQKDRAPCQLSHAPTSTSFARRAAGAESGRWRCG